MRETGFYREMQVAGSERPSMASVLGTIDAEEAVDVVRYLEAGNVLVVAAGYAGDGLHPERDVRVALGILTDGVWVWPAELAYYVETYGVGVDDEFIDHMRSRQWRVPPMDTDELTAMLEDR